MPRKPTIILVAGPNGSGKTSFAESLFANRRDGVVYINPDVIAAGLAPKNNSEGASFQAGRFMISRVRELIRTRESFGFESTLSGRTWLPLLRGAKDSGYRVTIYYLTLRSPALCLRRIRRRVQQGGHDIPPAAVQRRFPRSHENFWTLYRELSSSWFVFDNSGKRPLLLGSSAKYGKWTASERRAFELRFTRRGA